MKYRAVKITGIGPVTPAGIGREAFWKGMLEPISRVRIYPNLGEQYGPLVAAYFDRFDTKKYVELPKIPKSAPRHTLFALAAANLALADAGIDHRELAASSCAIVTGSSLMDFGGITKTYDGVYRTGAKGAVPRVIYTTNNASVPDAIATMLNINAKTMPMQSSCCAGLDAIGFAAGMVADGRADIAICGGTEAPLHRCPILELRAAGLTPTTTQMPDRLVRPFDLWRTTGVVSEGACLFVIEAEDSPREAYGYITGYAFASDDRDAPCSGMATAARGALAEARRRPHEIECINAWGPGHRLIDEAEAQSMVKVFGDDLANIPAVSIKAAIGSPLGAAGAIQTAVAALGLKHSLIPPTVNWTHPDPACPMNVSNQVRTVAHTRTLINAHGVGNVNASVILERR